VSITGIYPMILWELVADPLGSADHTLGTTFLSVFWQDFVFILVVPMCATFHTHLNLPGLPKNMREEQTMMLLLLIVQLSLFPIPFCHLVKNIFPGTLFSDTLSLCSLNMWNDVLRTYKIAGGVWSVWLLNSKLEGRVQNWMVANILWI